MRFSLALCSLARRGAELRRPAGGRVGRIAAALIALAAAGCGSDPLETPSDAAMTAMMAPPDLAAPKCAPSCAGVTPFCNSSHHCVACLADTDCPLGTICKVMGTAQSQCVKGCTSNDRCQPSGSAGTLACCGLACIDVGGSINNCGACGMVCTASHATSGCAHGKCSLGTCDAGYSDCNQDPTDGCEAAVRVDPANCTACGKACSFANGVPACSDGCYLAGCTPGFDDCDSNDANGCEVTLDTDARNCGACGVICGNPAHSRGSCVSAACGLTCDLNFGDCNKSFNDGCELPLASDVNNCGACGNVCPQKLVCVNGGCTCPQCNVPNAMSKCINNQCVFDKCNAGFGDCDNNQNNGCELDLSKDPKNCGACGNVCPMNAPYCSMNACTAKLPGALLGNIGGQDFYKVQVMGAMTDTNVWAACVGAGFRVPCQAPNGCQFNDNMCTATQENSCGNPMLRLSMALCGAAPYQCPALYGSYQYMGHLWNGNSACGAEQGQWCTAGAQQQNRFAVCVP